MKCVIMGRWVIGSESLNRHSAEVPTVVQCRATVAGQYSVNEEKTRGEFRCRVVDSAAMWPAGSRRLQLHLAQLLISSRPRGIFA